MNKFKKTAMIATSIVMAGTMAFSFAACGGGGSSNNNNTTENTASGGAWDATPSDDAYSFVELLQDEYGLASRTSANATGWTRANNYWTYLSKNLSTDVDENGPSKTYTSGTSINVAIGYNNSATGAFYSSITGSVTVPGGYTATTGKIKPAFSAIQSALGVTFVDKYQGKGTSSNLAAYTSSGDSSWGVSVDICTSDIDAAVEEANKNNNILNLADYLEYMPNFKAFLEENPVVYLSLLQSGMSVSDGSGKKIYVAPYFDGNDDIERYCLVRQDWVEDLLDDDLSYDGDTVATACGITSTSATGYMGSTGTYSVETSTEDGSGDTFMLTKDYDAAKTAAADSSTALGTAYYAIAGATYTGTSGNIVDIMNAAINAKAGAVSGKQLATLYRAYIDVAYINADTNKAAYSTRSDLFNGYSAAWDVDDLVAMLRIVKTNSENVGLDSYSNTDEDAVHTEGIFPRATDYDRTADIIRLVAQLYGERGADSRYEYTYIDANGNLQDMREQATFYQALENFSTLASEGLVYSYINSDGSLGKVNATNLKGNCGAASSDEAAAGNGFMMYDYSQTQTIQMYDLDENSIDSDYLFAAISTPVSRWDDDSDGVKDTIMRFTESWRSTKTGGLVVAASVANDSNKLAAVLAFIDYLYSNDGQILSTYGVQDTTNNSSSPNGTWYGTQVGTAVNSEYCEKVGGQWVVKEEYESQYFAFNDTLYTGTLYKGKMTPVITDELYTAFLCNDESDATFGAAYKAFGNRGSFTGYARNVLGATLPMGVKDQSFENQLTATQAAAEATKVSVSLANGTIKHPYLTVQDNPWYTVVPTSLPLSTSQQSVISDNSQSDLKAMTNTQYISDKGFYSIFHYIIFFGYTGTYSQQGVAVTF